MANAPVHIATAVEQELRNITADNTRESERAHLRVALTANCRTWAEELAEHSDRTRWRLLDAYLARTDAEFHPSDALHAERVQWARERARALPVAADLSCYRVCSRLLDGGALLLAQDAYKAAAAALVRA